MKHPPHAFATALAAHALLVAIAAAPFVAIIYALALLAGGAE